jgi:hypothetical protein
MVGETSAPIGKLPLWQSVRESYALGFRHLGDLVRWGWPVLAALSAVSLACYWFEHARAADADNLGAGWISFIAIPIVTVVFTAMMAVPWHRLVLKGQPLQGTSLTFTPLVLAYVAWGLSMVLPIYLGSYLVLRWAGGSETEAGPSPVLQFLPLILLLAALFLYVTFRIGIKLVVVALDDTTSTIAVIWRRTAWNFWRLFWGTTLTFVPTLVIGGLYAWLVPSEQFSQLGYAVAETCFLVATVLLGMISLTFLSLAYRHFMRPS